MVNTDSFYVGGLSSFCFIIYCIFHPLLWSHMYGIILCANDDYTAEIETWFLWQDLITSAASYPRRMESSYPNLLLM